MFKRCKETEAECAAGEKEHKVKKDMKKKIKRFEDN
jgi:hypothetical protein